MGFYKKGEGFKAVLNGELNAYGKLPVNTSGGLKAKGHPVGATGVGQIVTITEQLRGIFKGCALKNPKCGLAHNLGGSGSSVVVTILEVV